MKLMLYDIRCNLNFQATTPKLWSMKTETYSFFFFFSAALKPDSTISNMWFSLSLVPSCIIKIKKKLKKLNKNQSHFIPIDPKPLVWVQAHKRIFAFAKRKIKKDNLCFCKPSVMFLRKGQIRMNDRSSSVSLSFPSPNRQRPLQQRLKMLKKLKIYI